MQMPRTTLMKEISAKQRVKPTTRTEAKQKFLSKELIRPIITF